MPISVGKPNTATSTTSSGSNQAVTDAKNKVSIFTQDVGKASTASRTSGTAVTAANKQVESTGSAVKSIQSSLTTANNSVAAGEYALKDAQKSGNKEAIKAAESKLEGAKANVTKLKAQLADAQKASSDATKGAQTATLTNKGDTQKLTDSTKGLADAKTALSAANASAEAAKQAAAKSGTSTTPTTGNTAKPQGNAQTPPKKEGWLESAGKAVTGAVVGYGKFLGDSAANLGKGALKAANDFGAAEQKLLGFDQKGKWSAETMKDGAVDVAKNTGNLAVGIMHETDKQALSMVGVDFDKASAVASKGISGGKISLDDVKGAVPLADSALKGDLKGVAIAGLDVAASWAPGSKAGKMLTGAAEKMGTAAGEKVFVGELAGKASEKIADKALEKGIDKAKEKVQVALGKDSEGTGEA